MESRSESPLVVDPAPRMGSNLLPMRTVPRKWRPEKELERRSTSVRRTYPSAVTCLEGDRIALTKARVLAIIR